MYTNSPAYLVYMQPNPCKKLLAQTRKATAGDHRTVKRQHNLGYVKRPIGYVKSTVKRRAQNRHRQRACGARRPKAQRSGKWSMRCLCSTTHQNGGCDGCLVAREAVTTKVVIEVVAIDVRGVAEAMSAADAVPVAKVVVDLIKG